MHLKNILPYNLEVLMNCVKCGFEIPDGSIFCPSCGARQTAPESAPVSSAAAAPAAVPVSPVISAAPAASQAPVQTAAASASSGAGQAQSKSSGGIGGFFKAYFKNPIEAVSDHAKDDFWLWGLIILGAYTFLMFLLSFRNAFGYGTKYLIDYSLLQFVQFLASLIKYGTLIFALFLFQNVFKVSKKSIKSIIALCGLSFLPLVAADILTSLLGGVLLVNNLLSGIVTAAYVFAGLLIFLDYKKKSEDQSGLKSLFLVLCSFACMPIIADIINGIALWIYVRT